MYIGIEAMGEKSTKLRMQRYVYTFLYAPTYKNTSACMSISNIIVIHLRLQKYMYPADLLITQSSHITFIILD